MTPAALPAKESGPTSCMILSATTRDPLPETGRRKISDIRSSGILKKSKTGFEIFSMKSIAPDDVRASIAMNIPIIKGKISIHVFSPSFAPSMNTSYIGVFFDIPYSRITVIRRGRKIIENVPRISEIRLFPFK